MPLSVSSTSDLALVQGMRQTRETLAQWRDRPWSVIGRWLGLSLLIAAALLWAVYAIAKLQTPDPTLYYVPGINVEATLEDVGRVLFRNSLVLALHALACVAGFIAGSSLPAQAAGMTGWWRWVHEKAGPLAIAFVVGATAFSLFTQAFVLGGGTASLAAQFDLSPGVLLLSLLPHALPELTALFLPLAAWLVASHRGDWHQLLAATFVTVALAVPVLLVASVVEVYVSPRLLLEIAA